ncbi:MAG TPA: ATP-binding protein, partial [Candidatus Synoicihabitans sp.]|nr:ATP-binding protein [Candidatus Synoicihabitans sp.]
AQQESGAASPTLEKIYQVARSITRSMDEIVWAVNPRHDNSESFAYYLSNYARAFLEAAGVRCRIESPPTLPDAVLTSQTRHHLFLSCKETLHNVVKHANATVVTIRLSVEANRLVVVIADDGRGLGAEARASDGPDSHASSGNGLRNMRQRMNEIDGTCSVVSGPEGGTVVAFSVPLLPPFPAEPLDPPTASPTPTR